MTTSLSRIPAEGTRLASVTVRGGIGMSTSSRDPRPSASRPIETEYRPRRPLDLRRTVLYQRRGSGDPTMVESAGVIWRASRTPEGIATLALREVSRGVIRGAAWGPGARWAIEQLPRLCGSTDDPTDFEAERHPVVAEGHRRHPGVRLSRTDLLLDGLISAVFEQKVTGKQAFGAWRRIVTWCGERAPGPTPRPMFAGPTGDVWRRIPSWTWHRSGLEPTQARTIVEIAARETAIERTVTDASAEPSDDVLTSLRGIGAWTAAETRIRAFGDPDAVSIGDYHLAHEVGFALTGRRTDDDGMLELLEAWRGHRQRAIRLIGLVGPREPRRGPRLAPEDHREH